MQWIYNWYRNAIRHPQYRWWVILGTLVYLISPLDISPDVFPIAGQIDDFVVTTLLFNELFQLIIDHFKSIKTPPETSQQSSKGETIDVDAVSVEDS
ncbi:protein of unknown function DUF1232 [Rippkaea orientalis PCC 8801]|uniref:DUF1232 domain-containing protein n=1 Tax=Rippkaea orientalis (strain PCC 8801 / RF-1) TaxID=41431 RepID=B7JX09_RIPO1|nr:YkvA family protein [Rippkaea orientalis]ACK65858.1 protein of unknown function DUF1232 [Rippkaea orientalis PCC 8801]